MLYQDAISALYCRLHEPMLTSLGARFPALPAASIEDAVAHTFEQALERPTFEVRWRNAGAAGLERLLWTVAWRAVNTDRRTHARRTELLSQRAPVPAQISTPESIAIARDEMRCLAVQVSRASRRYGGRSPDRLERALLDRLAGSNDTASARRFGVRREAVNQARRWLRTAISA